MNALTRKRRFGLLFGGALLCALLASCTGDGAEQPMPSSGDDEEELTKVRFSVMFQMCPPWDQIEDVRFDDSGHADPAQGCIDGLIPLPDAEVVIKSGGEVVWEGVADEAGIAAAEFETDEPWTVEVSSPLVPGLVETSGPYDPSPGETTSDWLEFGHGFTLAPRAEQP